MSWITGNCLDVLPSFDAQSFDIVIADPPYDQMALINEAISQCRRISKVSFFFMYGENVFDLRQRPDQVLYWVKQPSTKNTTRRYSRFVEVICAYDIERSPFNQDTHWTTRSGVFNDSLISKPAHPHGKPSSLIEKLLRVNVSKGGRVLDPFAGSGTVAKVCAQYGYECVSIEIAAGWTPAGLQS